MYEAFYQLKHKPFSLLPDPEFLFMSSKHAIALSLLEYSLTGQAGFCVITGEIGSGKTTLVRAFLNRIGRDFTVALISNTHESLTDLAAWALAGFGRKPTSSGQAETYQELMAFLIAEYAEGRQCILIVDEAQNLSIEALEELRLLSNINSGKDLLLQIVLVGQPELLGKLRRPELHQFAQRIAVSHHLAPLAFTDTRRYIEHRLRVAGTERQVFTEMAMGAIQYFSGGVPRLINSICDMALVYGFADGASTIGEDLVFRVVADRQSSGIAPFARSESTDDPAVLAEIKSLAEAELGSPGIRTEPVDRAEPAELERSAETSVMSREPATEISPPWNDRHHTHIVAPRPRTDPEKSDLLFRYNESDDDLLLVDQADNNGTSGQAAQEHGPQDKVQTDAPHAGFRDSKWSARSPEATAATAVMRPSWQVPAAAIDAKPWPSIAQPRSSGPVKQPLSSVAEDIEAEPVQRAWWQWGFFR